MNNEDSILELRQQIQLGKKASYEFDLLNEAFDFLKKEAIDQILNSTTKDFEHRERMIITAQIIERVRFALVKMVENGESAKHVIKTIDEMEIEND